MVYDRAEEVRRRQRSWIRFASAVILALATLLVALVALMFARNAHAEFDSGQVAALEGLAIKWERDAATLLSGQVTVGSRQETMGRGLAFQRAAADLRLMLNRPKSYSRETQPQPWPSSDQRGTQKLSDLILPGFSAPGASFVEPPRAQPLDLVGPSALRPGFEPAP